MTRHDITAPQFHTWMLAIALLVGLPIGLTVLTLVLTQGMQAITPLAATIGFVAMVVVALLILMAMRRAGVVVERDALIVQAGFYTLKLPLTELQGEARVVDLSKDPQLSPKWRSNGIGLPGFQAGHFRLRDGSKAFLMLTDTARVLVLEERSGRKILLSVERPDALLRDLQRQA